MLEKCTGNTFTISSFSFSPSNMLGRTTHWNSCISKAAWEFSVGNQISFLPSQKKHVTNLAETEVIIVGSWLFNMKFLQSNRRRNQSSTFYLEISFPWEMLFSFQGLESHGRLSYPCLSNSVKWEQRKEGRRVDHEKPCMFLSLVLNFGHGGANFSTHVLTLHVQDADPDL